MPPREENKMGKWGATSYIIGNIVGSGIFITPTSILNSTSSVGMSLLIWVLSGVIATIGAYCYVELGTSIRKSGADFAYLCYVKWEAIAFAFMSMTCLIQFPATLAVQAETFAEYIVQGFKLEFCNQFHTFAVKKLIGFSIIWLLLYLNFFSVRIFVARFQIAASIGKLFATGIVIAVGAYYLIILGDITNLVDPFANSTLHPGNITNALFAGLFSYDGWDILNIGAEELENPRRTMSFAIIVGMSSVVAIFLSMNLSYFTILSIPEIQDSPAVAMTLAERTLGVLKYSMPFFVSLLLIGSLNSTLFSASRYIFAAAQEGQFPSFMSCRNVLHDSPRAALFTHIIFAMVLSFLGDPNQLILYASFSQWALRTLTLAALLYIRFWKIPVHSDAIKTPIIMPILFLIICLSLISMTLVQNFNHASISLLIVSIGFILYFLIIRDETLQRFKWYREWSHSINNYFSICSQLVFNGVIDVRNNENTSEKTDESIANDISNTTPKYFEKEIEEKISAKSMDPLKANVNHQNGFGNRIFPEFVSHNSTNGHINGKNGLSDKRLQGR